MLAAAACHRLQRLHPPPTLCCAAPPPSCRRLWHEASARDYDEAFGVQATLNYREQVTGVPQQADPEQLCKMDRIMMQVCVCVWGGGGAGRQVQHSEGGGVVVLAVWWCWC
jgi:hypothetical protein